MKVLAAIDESAGCCGAYRFAVGSIEYSANMKADRCSRPFGSNFTSRVAFNGSRSPTARLERAFLRSRLQRDDLKLLGAVGRRIELFAEDEAGEKSRRIDRLGEVVVEVGAKRPARIGALEVMPRVRGDEGRAPP